MGHTVGWTWPFVVSSHGRMHVDKLRLEWTHPSPCLQYAQVVLAKTLLPLSSVGHHLKSFKKREIFTQSSA